MKLPLSIRMLRISIKNARNLRAYLFDIQVVVDLISGYLSPLFYFPQTFNHY